MVSWIHAITDAVVTILIGTLALVGIGTQVTTVQNEEPQPPAIELIDSRATGTLIKQDTNVDEREGKNAMPPATKPVPHSVPKKPAPTQIEPEFQVEPKQVDVETGPVYQMLFQPPKSQYTQEELTELNAEAISYFKTNMSCDGLSAFALTYCQTFENQPEVQMIKAVLRHNAEVD